MVLESIKERLVSDKIVEYSEKQKMVKLILMILIPFYVVWGLFNFLFFWGFPVEWSIVELVCGFFAWGTGFVMLLSQRQMEAGQYHCFRQLCWRMNVTDRIKGDVYVDQGIEYIGLIGGYQVYKPHFPFALFYKHPDFNNGEGVTFHTAYWLLPDKWEQTFYHVPQQEAWYGALPVSVKGEDVTLHNLRWAMKDGEYIPVALVVDSNRHFEATIGRVQLKEEEKAPEVAQFIGQIASLTKANINLAIELAQEVQANKGLLKSTDNLESLVRDMVQDIKKRHGDVKRIPTPFRFPKINWRILVTGCVALALIGAIIFIVLHYW